MAGIGNNLYPPIFKKAYLPAFVNQNEYRIYFPIENGDLSTIYENQRVAKIRFKNLSVEYKDQLEYISEQILEDVSRTTIRKIIKNIERQI